MTPEEIRYFINYIHKGQSLVNGDFYVACTEKNDRTGADWMEIGNPSHINAGQTHMEKGWGYPPWGSQ